ncbi:MAG: hypothetical protein KDJ35_00710 [Alphaproteobacteria bacterium]|nr:hypothetical protein [Alphaproteobacteria bacterium]
MDNLENEIAISNAKYCILLWLDKKKARATKKADSNAPVHTYTVLDLTKSFNMALEELKKSGVSLELVKKSLYKDSPSDIQAISHFCDTLAARLPQKNLEGYTHGSPEI